MQAHARADAPGWDVAFTYWTPYDARMAWGIESDAADSIAETVFVEADLADPETPERVFDEGERRLGTITTLVMCNQPHQ